MFWTKKVQKQVDLDNMFFLKQKKFILKNRVKLACQDITDYELRLRDFCTRYKDVKHLLINVRDYRQSLIEQGVSKCEAARQTLEKFK